MRTITAVMRIEQSIVEPKETLRPSYDLHECDARSMNELAVLETRWARLVDEFDVLWVPACGFLVEDEAEATEQSPFEVVLRVRKGWKEVRVRC